MPNSRTLLTLMIDAIVHLVSRYYIKYTRYISSNLCAMTSKTNDIKWSSSIKMEMGRRSYCGLVVGVGKPSFAIRQ